MNAFSRRLLAGALLCVSTFSLAGCNRDAATTSAGGSTPVASQLVIISPNSQEIRDAFEAAWLKENSTVKIRWQDQGASSDDLRFVLAQYQRKAGREDEGIGTDIFFGGGPETFVQLEDKNLLAPLSSDYGVPKELNGVPLRGKNNVWIGSVLSGFGIFYNKTFAARDALPIPKIWNDLGDPKLFNRIELADPRHSGSAHAAYEVILQTNGWDKGWQALTAMTANARRYVQSSTELIQDVSSGEAVFAPAIDFYARSEIARSGEAKLGYIAPQGQEVLTPDPIGVLRGAPNRKQAERFVQFILSPEAQKLWMIKAGAPGGPAKNSLYRQAILPSLYEPHLKDSLIETNPFKTTTTKPYDAAKAAVRRQLLDDLIGAVLIDNHSFVRALRQKSPDAPLPVFVPITEAEAAQLSTKWSDQSFRQKKIVEWNQAARQKYGA